MAQTHRCRLAALAATIVLAAGCGTTGSASPPRSGSPPAAADGHWCGSVADAPPDKVMVIWEENHSAADVLHSGEAPTFRAVAQSCASATSYGAVTHPSLPNYLTMTSGQPYDRSPYDGDCSPTGACTTANPSVFGQEAAAGRTWASYAEAMPRPCDRTDSGTYAVRHNPATYYPALGDACQRDDVPLGTTTAGALSDAVRAGHLPTLATVTPDLEHDMHDGTVGQADTWLRDWLPIITAGPDYRDGRLAVIIAWDEGDGSGDHPSSAPLLALSAATRPGTRLTGPLDDDSVLRTINDITGLPPLGQAASAASFGGLLGAS